MCGNVDEKECREGLCGSGGVCGGHASILCALSACSRGAGGTGEAELCGSHGRGVRESIITIEQSHGFGLDRATGLTLEPQQEMDWGHCSLRNLMFRLFDVCPMLVPDGNGGETAKPRPWPHSDKP